ncbi:MAG: hypothetical protein PSX37_11425, partial [bacterium]|nr:hypothetical protein [bacterium]
MSSLHVAGLRSVAGLTFRLDRVRILAWALSMAGLTYAVANAWSSLYPTVQSREQFATALQSSPALTGLLGPLYNPISTGGLTAWRIGSGLVMVLGLVSAFIVVRHTRTDEAAGRTDLIRSAGVGRATPGLVAIGAAALIDLLFAFGAVIVLIALGEQVAGAFAFALGVAGGALVFAAVALLCAQLLGTSRAANGLASLIAALAFMAYAVGNSTPELDWLAMATPFGWANRSRPFAGENWWLVALPFVIAAALVIAGLLLGTRRDLGASIVAPRGGRPHAPRWLRSPSGLTWRLDRSQLATWVLAMLVLGIFVGYLAKTASDLLRSNPQLSGFLDRLGGDAGVSDSYVLVMLGVLSFGSAAYAVTSLLRTHLDETAGRLELLLAAPKSRLGLLTFRTLLVAGGVVVIQAAAGIGVGISNGLANHDVGSLVPRYLAVALIAVPAVWIIAGVAVAVVGGLPRWSWLAWVALGYCIAVGELGPILGLPEWTERTTPFWFSPKWPVDD